MVAWVAILGGAYLVFMVVVRVWWCLQCCYCCGGGGGAFLFSLKLVNDDG